MSYPNPILLYDGSCGFCQKSVQFILKHERDETIYFTPLQSDLGAQIKKDHPHIEGIDSILFLNGKDLFTESDAVLFLSSYLKTPYQLVKYTRLVPKVYRDSIYRFVAKHRHQLNRHNQYCLVPTASQNKRFLS